MKYFLGIDNGGTVIKASVFDQLGHEMASSSLACAPVSANPGYAERDSEELWRANCTVCREAVTQSGISPERIACVAVTGHGKGLYLWGKDGRPSYPGIVSTDTRAWKYVDRWNRDGTAARAYQKTKQHLLACQPVCLLAWLHDHEPAVLEKSLYAFECKDYIRFRMTGTAAAELTEISSAGVLNLTTGEYDRELLGLFGLEEYENLLPPLCAADEVAGYVSEEAAAACGLLAGTPVAGGTMDIIACALAAGITNDEAVCMVSGTWCINEYISRSTVTDGSILLNSYYCIPDYYVIEESSPTSTVNSEWFLQNLMSLERERAEAAGESIYEFVNREVKSIPDESFCPIFLPFIAASNVHPNACGSFVGISRYHTRAHLLRGIYEGIVFSHRYHLEKLLRVRERPPRTIRLAGGPARSHVWAQMFADAIQIPVERIPVKETGTLGCAILGARAIGAYPSIEEAVKEMTSLLEPLLPNRTLGTIFEQKYTLYRDTIRCLDGVWDEIQAYKDKNR